MMENGTRNIPFTVLSDDWRYFCLENVPQFLDGYPNDGCCMVDPQTFQVMDYNTTETARAYFEKLNEEYRKGILDAEAFTNSYEEYLNKLRPPERSLEWWISGGSFTMRFIRHMTDRN